MYEYVTIDNQLYLYFKLIKLRSSFRNKTESGWGPNAVFRFPQHGGTGGIWKKVSLLAEYDVTEVYLNAISMNWDTFHIHLIISLGMYDSLILIWSFHPVIISNKKIKFVDLIQDLPGCVGQSSSSISKEHSKSFILSRHPYAFRTISW